MWRAECSQNGFGVLDNGNSLNSYRCVRINRISNYKCVRINLICVRMGGETLMAEITRVCSYNVCSNGHQWQPAVTVSECPGCHSPVMAVRMEQCPICNEPTEEFALRSDHFNERGMKIAPLCKGEATQAEISQIVLKRNHAEDAEKGRVVTSPVKD